MIMGSGVSTNKIKVLECPKNYDNEKFKQICKLFDKLDQDSNLGVSSDELTKIAALHVKNCQTHLQKKIEAEKNALEKKLRDIDEEQIRNIASIRQQTKSAKEAATLESEQFQASLQNQLDDYASLDEDGQENAFMKVLMPKGENHVDFWTFFEYMKTRTSDIENIEK